MLKLNFNKIVLSPSDDFLMKLVTYFLANENIEDDEPKWVMSFITNSIVKKIYDELDFHEFVLESSFRVSVLLCHIETIFGRERAEKFASYLDEPWDSENYMEALSTKEALTIFHSVASEEISKFKVLLGKLYLFDIAAEDFKQTITDVNEFRKFIYVNGHVYVKNKLQNKLLLEPIIDYYKVDSSKYLNIGDIFIPPVMLESVMNISASGDSKITLSTETEKLFLKKLKQLLSVLPVCLIDTTDWKNCQLDEKIFGKWYCIEKSNDRFSGMTFTRYIIDDFQSNGKIERSVGLRDWSDNFVDLDWEWKTEEGKLHISEKQLNKIYVHSYVVDGNILSVDEKKYFRDRESAMLEI